MNERVAFTEEKQPGQHVRIIAAGEVDESLLEAIDTYTERQRQRLERQRAAMQKNENSDGDGI